MPTSKSQEVDALLASISESLADSPPVAATDEQDEVAVSEPDLPPALAAVVHKIKRRLAHHMILSGMAVHDYVLPGVTLRDYIALVLSVYGDEGTDPKPRNVIFYSPDEGITFADESPYQVAIQMQQHERLKKTTPFRPAKSGMREEFEKLVLPPQATAPMAAQLLGQTAQPAGQPRPLPKLASEAIPLIYEYIRKAPDNSVLVVVDRLEYITPTPEARPYAEKDTALLSGMIRAGTDPVLERKEPIFLMLTTSQLRIHADMRAKDTGFAIIDVPMPNAEQRRRFIQTKMAGSRPWLLAVEPGQTPESALTAFVDRTAGMLLRHIEDVALAAAGEPITTPLIQAQRNEIFKSAYAGALKIIEPTEGFDGHGGHTEAITYLREWVTEPWATRDPQRLKFIPVGVRFTGQPGTGKTDLAARVAYEMNAPLIILGITKGKYVGESDALLDTALTGALEIGGVLFIDEIDQKFRRVTGGGGDGGSAVEATQFSYMLEFIGPKLLGKLFVIGACNRPDVVDAALLREGRLEVGIPLLEPQSQEERVELLVTLLSQFTTAKIDMWKLDKWATATTGFTQSEVRGLVRYAAGLASQRGIPFADAMDMARKRRRASQRSEYALMKAYAIRDCTDWSVLPESVRAEQEGKEDEEFEDEIATLQRRVGLLDRSDLAGSN